jgi:hypothetical protein
MNMLQNTLLTHLEKSPEVIHPQNIGDMVQALAVLRIPAHEKLLPACSAWMKDHIKLLLPNHILAYLNVRAPQCFVFHNDMFDFSFKKTYVPRVMYP